MKESLDPYTPGAGRRPTVLVGRDSELEAVSVRIDRANHGLSPTRPMLLVGLRGVGKTVLLNRMRHEAADAGWLTLKIEGERSSQNERFNREALAAGLAQAVQALGAREGESAIRRALGTLASFSFSVGLTSLSLGVERDLARASTGNLNLDLVDVLSDIFEAQKSGQQRVLAIFVDEMQDLDDELVTALVTAQHQAQQEGWNFYLVGAGLPGLPAHLAESRSYAERMFEVHPIGPLSEEESRRVLVEPVQDDGIEWEAEALELLVRHSGGYPYFLQEFGSAMWRVAPSSPFTYHDAVQAVELGLQGLDQSLFSARWDRATPAERDYLVALSSITPGGDGEASSAAVAAALEKSPSSLGPARARLMSKGLIFAPSRGKVAFTVPGFAAFISRRRDLDL